MVVISSKLVSERIKNDSWTLWIYLC
jgi:hypothetical protein